MKLSNNAIKFLMAQYRAIYKNAYVKGLATAVILTSALAAGQAQAVTQGKKIDDAEWAKLNGPVEVVDTTNFLDIKGKNATNSNEFVLDLQSGSNVIQANGTSGAAVKADKGTIKITSTKGDATLDISTAVNGSGASLDIKAVEVIKGKLTTKGSGAQVTAALNAGAITIGGTEAGASGTVELGDFTQTGYSLAGTGINGAKTQDVSNYSTIKLISGGKLGTADTLTADLGQVKVDAANLVISGGTLSTGADSNLSGSGALFTVNLVQGQMDSGTIQTKSTKASDNKLSLIFADGNWKSGDTAVEKVFTINGGTLDLATDMVVSGAGVVKFGKDLSKLDVKNKGITVSGSAGVYADDAAHAATVIGALPITLSGGAFEIGSGDVDLTAADNKIKFAADAAKGTIGIKDGSFFKANNSNVTVSGDLAAKMTVEADGFTIKSGSAVTLTKTKVKADSSLTLLADTVVSGGTDTSITLGAQSLDSILASDKYKAIDTDKTLSPEQKVAAKKSMLINGTGGSISGNKLTLQSGGTLTVANGNWTAKNEIELKNATTSGKLVVGAQNGVASLTFAAGSKLNVSSGTISVGASSASPQEAVLDISALGADNLTLTKGSLTADKNGTLIADATQIGDLTAENFKTIISGGGTLQLNGDVELAKSKIATSDTAGKLIFSGAAGSLATLKADTLTITGADSVNIGEHGVIKATSLTLNNIDNSGAAQPVKLGSGNYIVTEELLTEKNGTVLELGQNASLQLGDIGTDADGNNYSVTTAGNTNMSLKLNHSGAKVDFVTGKWGNNKTSLDVVDGQVNIGSELLDANYNVIAAQVTGNKLTQASGGITLNSGSTATFTEIAKTGGELIIEGDFVIEGKHTPYEAAVSGSNGVVGKPEVLQSFGVKLDKAKVIGANASLTIGAEAMGAIASIDNSVDSKTVKVNYKLDKESGAALDLVSGAITLEDFGTLKLGFDSGDKFTLDQLKAIRKEFLGKEEAIDTGFISLGNATIDGVTPSGGTLAFTELNKFKDFTDFVVGDLKDATITGVDGTVNGNVGRLETEAGSVTVGVATLNNCKGGAFAYEKGTGEAVKITVNKSGLLGLNNGGKAGEVILNDGVSRGTTLLISGGSANVATDVAKISAKGTNTEVQVASGILNVKGGVTAGSIKTSADTTLNVEGYKSATGLTLSNEQALSEFKGNVNAQSIKVSFAGETIFAGNNNNFLLMSASGTNGNLTFKNGTTTVSSMLGIDVSKAVDNGVDVLDNAVLNVDGAIKLGAQSYLGVGSEHEYAADGKTVVESGSTGYLYAKMVDLNGGIMGVDPEYGMKTSIAAVGAFGAGTFNLLNANDAGTVSGDVVVSQNAALGVGQSVNLDTVKNFVAQYQDADDSLSKDGVANVMYIDGKIMHKSGRIILDGQNRLDDSVAVLREGSTAFAYGYDADSNKSVSGDELADLYIGNGSILALGNGAVNGAIEFADATAQIYAPASADSKKAQQGKIVLAGEDFLKSRNITLFTAGAKAATNGKPDSAVPGSAKNVTVLGETGKDDIRVESLNGLMYFTLEAGKALEETGYNLKLDTKRVDTAFTAASAPMRDFLIGYTAQDKNWSAVAYGEAGAVSETLLGNVAGAMVTAANGTVEYAADATEEFKQANPLSNFVAVNTGTAEAPQYVAYEKAYNGFLEDVVR
ncbi:MULTISPECIES: hypothetical protein, partial [unclassified Anaerobiospirillum]|uniref:beta strand repeat-containing protein n=1 Tax=unclassified Anaerobiospirillum TaxID=2647410 RepID=UPI001FF6BA73